MYVGIPDGCGEGEEVGNAAGVDVVGWLDGLEVGNAVSMYVGSPDGCGVGEEVGNAVGVDVGISVGWLDGLEVGRDVEHVGNDVGIFNGTDDDGAVLGLEVDIGADVVG